MHDARPDFRYNTAILAPTVLRTDRWIHPCSQKHTYKAVKDSSACLGHAVGPHCRIVPRRRQPLGSPNSGYLICFSGDSPSAESVPGKRRSGNRPAGGILRGMVVTPQTVLRDRRRSLPLSKPGKRKRGLIACMYILSTFLCVHAS